MPHSRAGGGSANLTAFRLRGALPRLRRSSGRGTPLGRLSARGALTNMPKSAGEGTHLESHEAYTLHTLKQGGCVPDRGRKIGPPWPGRRPRVAGRRGETAAACPQRFPAEVVGCQCPQLTINDRRFASGHYPCGGGARLVSSGSLERLLRVPPPILPRVRMNRCKCRLGSTAVCWEQRERCVGSRDATQSRPGVGQQTSRRCVCEVLCPASAVPRDEEPPSEGWPPEVP